MSEDKVEDTEESTETEEEAAVPEHIEIAQRMYLSEIMRQLTESDRFNRFFKINYEVQTQVDEENEQFNVILIERPPELAAIHLKEMLDKFESDNEPDIALPTAADIAAVTKLN
jgi:hypothetical protein